MLKSALQYKDKFRLTAARRRDICGGLAWLATLQMMWQINSAPTGYDVSGFRLIGLVAALSAYVLTMFPPTLRILRHISEVRQLSREFHRAPAPGHAQAAVRLFVSGLPVVVLYAVATCALIYCGSEIVTPRLDEVPAPTYSLQT